MKWRQQTHGTPPRRCYHDRQWAAKMKEIGLQHSPTGEPGGKESDQSVTNYIIPGGAYATAFAKLQATGFQLHWESAHEGRDAKAKKASRTKFPCPGCEQNAWAKPDALLICGVCHEDGDITLRLPSRRLPENPACFYLRCPARRSPHPA
jgi:hypothetical protein